MKRLILSLVLAGATALPIAASAQQAPPNPPPAAGGQQWQRPDRAQMQQMRKMHEQFRAQILGALTPEHRALLAQVVGNLAVAANPDRRAAAAQLDAALSPGEKSNVLAAAKQMRDQMREMRKDAPRPPRSQRAGEKREHRPMTAGTVLLMTAGDHGMMMRPPGGGR